MHSMHRLKWIFVYPQNVYTIQYTCMMMLSAQPLNYVCKHTQTHKYAQDNREKLMRKRHRHTYTHRE